MKDQIIIKFEAVEGYTFPDPSFTDFYESTYMETSGRNEVDLCVTALMLLRLAKDKNVLEPNVLDAIRELITKT